MIRATMTRGAVLNGILALAIWAGPGLADEAIQPRRTFGLGEVQCLAASPDLRFIASGGKGGAFLWDAATATLLKRMDGDGAATALAFSPDSKVLAMAGRGRIAAWNCEEGRLVQEWAGNGREITRLQFTADGARLVSASTDNTARVWSMESGAEIQAVRTPGSPIVDVAISADGQRLATVDTFLTNCVKVWEIETGRPLAVIPKTNWTAQLCRFTPEGHLLTTGADRSVLLWNTGTGEVIRSFEGITSPTAIVLDLWQPGETVLAAACNDGRVFLWELASGALLRTVTGDPVLAAMGVPNDHLVLSADLDSDLLIRQLPGGDLLRRFKGHTTSSHAAVAFSPDGRFVLSGGTESATRLWDRKSGQPVRNFPGSGAGTTAAAFSPDGSKVLTTTGLPRPAALLWNTETGAIERELAWSDGWPAAAVFSPNGAKVAARAQDGKIRIYDVASGALERTLNGAAWTAAMAISPSAALLAAAAEEFSAALYHYETGQRLHTFSANAGPVISTAFSPDGETLMIGWQDGLVRLYNTSTLELRREFMAEAAFLESAAFSPDGRFILTGEGWPFFTATLWDTARAEPVRVFKGHQWTVSAVAFNREGTSILTGAELVREWAVADLAAGLKMERLGQATQVTWRMGELQRAFQIEGPWRTLPEATSPFHVPADEPAGYFRVRLETE